MWSNQENRVRKQVKNPCEARKIKASQILHKKISTHHLTVLITSVIVRLEQRKKRKFTSTLFLFGANVSTQIDKEEADYEYQ
ncbi:hypothetical protein DXB83_07100 [Blautia sp. OM06-15AC]|nr:hypothetical protein DXB83_07100 [Blautia sp. OM06-15AC]